MFPADGKAGMPVAVFTARMLRTAIHECLNAFLSGHAAADTRTGAIEWVPGIIGGKTAALRYSSSIPSASHGSILCRQTILLTKIRRQVLHVLFAEC
jgi:hypothetical protein